MAQTLEQFIQEEGYEKGTSTQEIFADGVRLGAKWQQEQAQKIHEAEIETECIDFAEWILQEGFEKYYDRGMYSYTRFGEDREYSTGGLYDMWYHTKTLKNNNMAQTSVEWLVSHLNKQEWFTFKQKEYIDQAKKMHEEESNNAYKKGWKDGWKDAQSLFLSEQRKTQ